MRYAVRSRQAAKRDLVGFHFGCSDFARSHSMTDAEGGERSLAASWMSGSDFPKAAVQAERSDRFHGDLFQRPISATIGQVLRRCPMRGELFRSCCGVAQLGQASVLTCDY